MVRVLVFFQYLLITPVLFHLLQHVIEASNEGGSVAELAIDRQMNAGSGNVAGGEHQMFGNGRIAGQFGAGYPFVNQSQIKIVVGNVTE
jgi:hypothetical protein